MQISLNGHKSAQMSLNKPERIWMSLNVLKWALMSSITSSIELYNYVKMKCLSPLPFQGKIRLLFAIFGIFLQGNSAWSQVKGGTIKIWKILFHSHDSWSTSYEKNFGSNVFQFCDYRSQRIFQKNFKPDSQIWLVFLVPFLYFSKRKFNYLLQNLMLNW